MDPVMDPATNHGKKIRKKREKKESEIRTPDAYKTETLVDPLNRIHLNSFQNSLQDISCDELEQAKLASLEESWKYTAACQKRWTTFQPILARLQRLGAYDKNIKTVYDLLSVGLYRDSYHIESSISESEYNFIDQQLKLFRMTPTEKSNLYEALHRLGP
jgi:hypothetical protein